MDWVWTVLFGAAMFVFLMCLLPVQVHIRYVRDGERDHLWIQLRALFGLIKYTIEMPVFKLVMSKDKPLRITAQVATGVADQPKKKRPRITLLVKRIARLLELQRELTEHLHNFLGHVRKSTKTFRITEIKWQTELGTGDAALTGTAAGLVWSVKGAVLGLLAHFFSLRVQPVMAVQPRFHELMLRTSLDCIIRFWLGQAIVAAIQLGMYMLREGKKSWQIIRSRV
ncbi:DUF2953 domain-containing protein [Effusibacillus pohliae]|uniref:DUF2953 domain-containing protein n=1 Tax=Effusibacillus pohliae TaxID=232270 RepID=UPI000372DBA8|nr:DUF2953 domain-containing protein [Effusibacillus pohliae]